MHPCRLPILLVPSAWYYTHKTVIIPFCPGTTVTGNVFLRSSTRTGKCVHSREEVLFWDITKLSYIVYPQGVTMGKHGD